MEEQKEEIGGGFGVKIGIIAVLLIAVVLVVILKNSKNDKVDTKNIADQRAEEKSGLVETVIGPRTASENINNAAAVAKVETKAVLPKLLDLGAGTCIPCKMMEPVLEELTGEFAGKMDVQFIDVKKNPGAGQKYGIKIIPTQIFFDTSGKELFRHEGFFSKEEILKKWKELGIEISGEQGELKKETGSIEKQPEASPGGC